MSDQPKSMADIGFIIDERQQQLEELILIVGWLIGTLTRHKIEVPIEVAWMLKRQGFALFKDAEPPT